MFLLGVELPERISKLRKKFGLPLAALFILLSIVWSLAENYETLARLTNWSGLGEKVGSLKKVQASAEAKFQIGVARFDDDPQDYFQALFLRELSSIAGVNAFAIPRTVLSGEELRRNYCYDKARSMLSETKADAIVWGKALRTSAQAVPQTVWTSRSSCGTYQLEKRYVLNNDLTLPNIAINDLLGVLQGLVRLESDLTLSQKTADGSPRRAAEKIRNLLVVDEAAAGWSRDSTKAIYLALADIEALDAFFRQPVDEEALSRAEQTQKLVLEKFHGQLVPRERAVVWFHLGQMQRARAIQNRDTKKIIEANQAFIEAAEAAGIVGEEFLSRMILAERAFAAETLAIWAPTSRNLYSWAVAQKDLSEFLRRHGPRHKEVESNAIECDARIRYSLKAGLSTQRLEASRFCLGVIQVLGRFYEESAEINNARILAMKAVLIGFEDSWKHLDPTTKASVEDILRRHLRDANRLQIRPYLRSFFQYSLALVLRKKYAESGGQFLLIEALQLARSAAESVSVDDQELTLRKAILNAELTLLTLGVIPRAEVRSGLLDAQNKLEHALSIGSSSLVTPLIDRASFLRKQMIHHSEEVQSAAGIGVWSGNVSSAH